MNHYPHHIGDFDKATRHLTRIERSIYRDLLDLYYDTESALSLDLANLCRKIVARSNEESTSVEQVLNEFFTKTLTGWYHARCEQEICKFHANTSQKAQAGKASAAAKALKKQQALNGMPTAVETPLNGTSTNPEPRTQNPEPIKDTACRVTPVGFDDFWKTYPKRTAKPAALRAFKSAKINGHLGDVLAHVGLMSSSEDWTKNSGQFIPNPATYLNQRRWEDEAAVPVAAERFI